MDGVRRNLWRIYVYYTSAQEFLLTVRGYWVTCLIQDPSPRGCCRYWSKWVYIFRLKAFDYLIVLWPWICTMYMHVMDSCPVPAGSYLSEAIASLAPVVGQSSLDNRHSRTITLTTMQKNIILWQSQSMRSSVRWVGKSCIGQTVVLNKIVDSWIERELFGVMCWYEAYGLYYMRNFW